jgi:hypothetical protein
MKSFKTHLAVVLAMLAVMLVASVLDWWPW